MSYRPSIESLEHRLMPHAPIPLGHGIVGPALAYAQPPQPGDPVIEACSITIVGQEGESTPKGVWYTFYGTVSSPNPWGLIVRFSNPGGGVAEVIGQTAETDGNGNYSLYILLAHNDVGAVRVDVTDWNGDTANATDIIFVS